MQASSDLPPINLLYVASIGRSGSTLFECMLGAHSQMVTCGEVQIWPHEILEGGVQPTGSGEYVQDSDFWQEMERRVRPLQQPKPQLHFFREQHRAGRALRPERLRDIGNSPLSSDTATKVRQYGFNNYKLFSTFLDLVQETTGRRPKWIVDASKDPYRLLWLQRSGYFNTKAFHLVKDPRSFIYSVTRRWIRSGESFSQPKQFYYTVRQSLAWVIRNHLFSKIAQNHFSEHDFMLVQYERLASRPKEVFNTVCNFIGCDFEEQAVDNFRSGSPLAIAGNPMRQDDRDGIKLDERWKRQLPHASRLVAQLVTAVNRSKFGYPVF